MFHTNMSPKVLNVEKLEKKFASLTKSRESIQGLSMWIIRHKEFYREIVNEWLDALTRDLNALTMFYVANDVIQNCGRKRAPEFRDAFRDVLERAMSLEKVKEIKNEVTRMITLWNERAIYDDIFFRKLQDKLNAVTDQPHVEAEETELTEAEVIANFKLENLISSLRKLKTLEEELLEKESFLEDIEEPGMSNIDNLIVKMESQKELQKIDKFQNLVEDYLSLSEKVILAKKAALLNLKYSSIFYGAQLEDAKKVVHAYRIYGKKVKMLEKSLSEKLLTFPHESPVLSEKSPDVELNSSQDLKTFGIGSKTTETELSISPADKKDESPSAETQSLPLSVFNIEKSISMEKIWKSPLFFDTANSMSNENISKSPAVADASKSPVVADTSKSPVVIDTSLSPVIADASKSPSDEKIMKSPLVMDTMKGISSEEKHIKISEVDNAVKNVCDDKKNLKTSDSSIENLVKNSTSLETKVDLSIVKVGKSDSKESSKNESQTLPDVECIDFLLEKAYDDHQVKSKLSFKRKIDNLLKSKQSKACKLSNDEEDKGTDSIVNNSQDNTSLDADLSENPLQGVSYLVKNETEPENVVKLESSVKKDESNIDAGNAIDAEMNKTPNVEQTENSKPDQSIEMEKESDVINSKDTLSSTSFELNTLPDIPTELLKNILDKNRKNMNISLGDDPCSSSDRTSFIADSKDHSDVNLVNLNDRSMENGNQYSPSITVGSDSKILNTSNIKSVCDEMLIKGTQDGSEFIKRSVSSIDSLSSVDSAQRKCVVKSTNFLENLQSVLECLTKKETNINKLKCSETLNSLPSVPLKNTLDVYSCIMQCYHSDSLSSATLNSNINGNTSSNIPAKGFLNDEEPCSFETDHKLQEMSANKDLSLNDKNKTGFTEFNSKDDNLEIMDMEVDSDDEDTT